MANDKRIDAYCKAILGRGMYSTRTNLERFMNYVFRYTPLEGKDMLDIGGGPGLMSLYAAARGARSVLNLEPEERSKERFDEVAAELGCQAVEFMAQTFQQFDPESQQYDVILSHNSVNHLDEESVVRLPNDADARNRYHAMFVKLAAMARPGAYLILADCSNRNIFGDLGIRNPLVPSIEWPKHQPPRVWITMLR